MIRDKLKQLPKEELEKLIEKLKLEIKQIEQREIQGLTPNRMIENLQEKTKDNELEEATNKANDVEIKNNLEVNNDLENNLENNINENNNLENNIFEENENFINEKIDGSNESGNDQYSEEDVIQNQGVENSETDNMEKIIMK